MNLISFSYTVFIFVSSELFVERPSKVATDRRAKNGSEAEGQIRHGPRLHLDRSDLCAIKGAVIAL